MNKAADPRSRLPEPPLMSDINCGATERLVQFNEHSEQQKSHWNRQANDPEVIDSIGIAETVKLCEARFPRYVSEYRRLWTSLEKPRTEVFACWLREVTTLVISEAKALWTGEWHAEWFTRACESKIAAALKERVLQEIG